MSTQHGGGASPPLDLHSGGSIGGMFSYVPAFIYVLIMYIVGKMEIADPLASIVSWGPYHLSWAEVLLVLSAVIAIMEQLKVSHPGIDNTVEALIMLGLGGFQLILLLLGARTKTGFLVMFNTTEFLLVTFISLAAGVAAILINARSLRRTIGVGDG